MWKKEFGSAEAFTSLQARGVQWCDGMEGWCEGAHSEPSVLLQQRQRS